MAWKGGRNRTTPEPPGGVRHDQISVSARVRSRRIRQHSSGLHGSPFFGQYAIRFERFMNSAPSASVRTCDRPSNSFFSRSLARCFAALSLFPLRISAGVFIAPSRRPASAAGKPLSAGDAGTQGRSKSRLPAGCSNYRCPSPG